MTVQVQTLFSTQRYNKIVTLDVTFQFVRIYLQLLRTESNRNQGEQKYSKRTECN